MGMKSKAFQLALMAGLVNSGSRNDSTRIFGPKPSDLQKYYTPPRSMTPEEKEYYDKHKNLNGFNHLSEGERGD